jgi:methyl-accepting chemotaxis protein
MTWFTDLSIRKKISVIAVAALLTMFAVAGIGIVQTRKVNDGVIEMATNWLPSVNYLSGMKYALADFRVYEYRHTQGVDSDAVKFTEYLLSVELNRFKVFRAKYAQVISLDQEREGYQEFSGYCARYFEIHERLLQCSRSGQRDAARNLLVTESKQMYAWMCWYH